MTRSLLFLLILVPVFSQAQKNIGKTKAVLKKELLAWRSANASLLPKITETTSTTTVRYNDPGLKSIESVYIFDRKNICISERTLASSDSIRRVCLDKVLALPEYEWKKINGNQYISRFSDQLMIELPGDPKNFSFTIYRAAWTKELYDMLSNN